MSVLLTYLQFIFKQSLNFGCQIVSDFVKVDLILFSQF